MNPALEAAQLIDIHNGEIPEGPLTPFSAEALREKYKQEKDTYDEAEADFESRMNDHYNAIESAYSELTYVSERRSQLSKSDILYEIDFVIKSLKEFV